jgi:hypothetical protein
MGAALPLANIVHALGSFSFHTVTAALPTPRSFVTGGADARAPPVLPMVIANYNHDWRNDGERIFAMRAARADMGGGVLRFGVLLA